MFTITPFGQRHPGSLGGSEIRPLTLLTTHSTGLAGRIAVRREIVITSGEGTGGSMRFDHHAQEGVDNKESQNQVDRGSTVAEVSASISASLAELFQ